MTNEERLSKIMHAFDFADDEVGENVEKLRNYLRRQIEIDGEFSCGIAWVSSDNVNNEARAKYILEWLQ